MQPNPSEVSITAQILNDEVHGGMQLTDPNQTQPLSHDNQPHDHHDDLDGTKNHTIDQTNEESTIPQLTLGTSSSGTIIPTIPTPSQRLQQPAIHRDLPPAQPASPINDNPNLTPRS